MADVMYLIERVNVTTIGLVTAVKMNIAQTVALHVACATKPLVSATVLNIGQEKIVQHHCVQKIALDTVNVFPLLRM